MPATALLVIDIQQAAFDGVFIPPITGANQLVAQAGRLIEAAREGGTPVIFIQHCEGAGEPFEEGTPHWALHPQLVPLAAEAIVRKHQSSAFEGTGLNELLQQLQVTELAVCGLQSEFCVSNTSKSALKLGYGVKLAQDGHTTWPSEGRSAASITSQVNAELQALGAVLMPTQALAERVAGR